MVTILLEKAEVFPLGEQTLLVRIRTEETGGEGAASDPAVSAMHALLALAAKIEAEAPPGLKELVPAGRALAIVCDPLVMDHEAWHDHIRHWIAELPAPDEAGSRTIEIPVVYGGDFGPDLPEVAEKTGMDTEEVIRMHSGATYMVGMIGFAPGFPYLLGLPDRLAVPRRAVPRTEVPAGSVAIGGTQTGIYPADLPGGWHIIGRTSAPLFDPEASPPSLLAPGDRVRFVPMVAFPTEPASGNSTSMAKAGRRTATGKQTATDTPPSVSGFHVRKPGLYTTLQDAGRPGLQRFGVSPGGAMDMTSYRLANLLVGNRSDEPALEMTLAGPELDVLADIRVAVCGADMGATLNDQPLPTGRPVQVKRGDKLRFGTARAGCRAYLAVAGGFAIPPLLGGSGTYPAAGLPGLLGRALAAGDELPVHQSDNKRGADTANMNSKPSVHGTAEQPSPEHAEPQLRWHLAPQVPLPIPGQTVPIRVVPGPEFEHLSPEAVRLLLEQSYTVDTRSNRMGLRLSGAEPIPSPELPATAGGSGMISEAVARGTVQLPSGGLPIVLAADRQTTGGYPRVLQVVAADWPLLGQAAPGVRFAFHMTDLKDAVALMTGEEGRLRTLAWAIKNKFAE